MTLTLTLLHIWKLFSLACATGIMFETSQGSQSALLLPVKYDGLGIHHRVSMERECAVYLPWSLIQTGKHVILFEGKKMDHH